MTEEEIQYDNSGVLDGWDEIDARDAEEGPTVRWKKENQNVVISISPTEVTEPSRSDPPKDNRLVLAVDQGIEYDDLGTVIRTEALGCDSLEQGVEMATNRMEDLDDGIGRIYPIGTEAPDDSEYVEFYCLNGATAPDGINPDEMVDSLLESKQAPGTTGEVDGVDYDEIDPMDESVVTIDVYPKHESEVSDNRNI